MVYALGRLIIRSTIVIERAGGNYSAYVPDLPGCAATGATPEEAERQISEAIELHIHGLREDALPIPPATTICRYVEARDAAWPGNRAHPRRTPHS
jgi:predicted RNase H-like HicB family nuclease